MEAVIKTFKVRLSQHTKNAKYWMGKNGDKFMFYLGKMKECTYIIEHLKLQNKINKKLKHHGRK